MRNKLEQSLIFPLGGPYTSVEDFLPIYRGLCDSRAAAYDASARGEKIPSTTVQIGQYPGFVFGGDHDITWQIPIENVEPTAEVRELYAFHWVTVPNPAGVGFYVLIHARVDLTLKK